MLTAQYLDLIQPQKKDDRSAAEIVADVAGKAGLKLK
jgi:hypothetical protein